MKRIIYLLFLFLIVACVKQYPYTLNEEPRLVVNSNIKANAPIEVYVCGIGGGRVDSLDVSVVVNHRDTIRLDMRGYQRGYAYSYMSQKHCVSGDSLELLICDRLAYYPDVKAKTCVPDMVLAKVDNVYKLPNNGSITENNWRGSSSSEDSLCVFEFRIEDPVEVDNYYNIYCLNTYDENDSDVTLNGSYDPIFKDERVTTSLKGNAVGFSGVVTDEMFNGTNYGFSIYTRSRSGSSKAIKNDPEASLRMVAKRKYYVFVQHINEDYYRYLKEIEVALCAQKDLFAEPILFSSIETNLEGGYGFFSACSTVVLEGEFTFYIWMTICD